MPAELNALKFIVKIDRRGNHDAVYYDCDNLEFEKCITSKGFKTAFGSFSDISYVALELGVAAAAKETCTKYAYVKNARDIGIHSDLGSSFYRANKIYLAIAYRTFKKDTVADFEEITPKKLPQKYEELFDEVLDFYTAEELEQYREEYGDQILQQLYIDE